MKRILVIQTGKLGDMVCTTPVFRAIKTQFPHVELVVCGDAVNKQVLAGNPHVNTYVLISDISTYVATTNLDAAFLLTPNPRILGLLLRYQWRAIRVAPRVVGGFSPYQTRLYRLLLLAATAVPHHMHHYAPQEYLHMLSVIGIHSDDTRKDIYIDPVAKGTIATLISPYKARRVFMIAAGAGNSIKEWPPERFHEVAQYAIQKLNALVVLVGGPKDRDLSAIVKNNLPSESVLDATGTLSIEELKALVARADIFVSADTGPIYIAEALNIPTVDIIGPVDEAEQPPRGDRHVSVVPPGREKPEMFVMNARMYNKEKATELARATPVQAVIKAVESLVSVWP